MKWNNLNLEWNSHIENEAEKQELAKKVASKVNDGDVIGFGSGSTSYIAIKEIAKKINNEKLNILAIPTSYEIKLLCDRLNIPTVTIMEYKPDWSFDGADEYNDKNWMIKGRGAAMFKEKLNIVSSNKVYILADNTKYVDRLGKNHSIPVECFPEAIKFVKKELEKLGANECNIRTGRGKDGPIITENNNLILDAKFNEINEKLEKDIKLIPGVIESGLFIGYNNVEILK
ncbi:MAG: ribose 5-phosphate isomerase A [Clostridia bacterium]|nr:ribose 5-phosphate isomerase A [Clostridia bacterium]